MVKFICNLILYWRFKLAFRKCDRLNRGRKNNLYIVANINGTPYVVNRKTWRTRQLWHPKLRRIKWSDVAKNQVTRKILE